MSGIGTMKSGKSKGFRDSSIRSAYNKVYIRVNESTVMGWTGWQGVAGRQQRMTSNDELWGMITSKQQRLSISLQSFSLQPPCPVGQPVLIKQHTCGATILGWRGC